MNKQVRFEDLSLIDTPIHYHLIDIAHRKNTTIEQDLNKLEYSIDCCLFICGKGGSHIWISDKITKERKAIIYYR